MALIPPHYLKSVVSIEIERRDEEGKSQMVSIATAFLLATLRGEKDEEGKELYNLSLVTNRHVYENPKTKEKLKEVFLRFNTTDGKSRYAKAPLLKEDGSPMWFKHKNDKVDIAVLPLIPGVVYGMGIEFHFLNGPDIFFAKDFQKLNISSGDGVYVLGFPMGISGRSKKFVIVRHGIIARVDEELLSEHFYYIDASAYPGNSGGPVIHKPEVVSVSGTGSNSKAGLIGVVSSGETYTDVAVSQQTGDPRIVFTEQTGLVRIVPMESVIEAIDDFITEKKVEESKLQKVEDLDNKIS